MSLLSSYEQRSRQLDVDLLVFRVPDHLRRVIVGVRLLSWDRKRDAAPVGELFVLAAALQMNPGDCSRAIAEAQKMKVLRVLRLGGGWWLELLPDAAVWIERSTTKVQGKRATAKKSRRAPSLEEVARAREAWAALEAEGDPAQAALPMEVKPSHPPLGDAGMGDALAAASRDEADRKARLGNSQSDGPPRPPRTERLGNSQFERQIPNPPDLGNSQVTHARARARTMNMVHVPTSVPQSMVHGGHGRSFAEEDRFAGMGREDLESLLDEESGHWYRQLEEIFGDHDAEAYRLTWLKRLCDRWKNCAWRAIGEVKRMRLQGDRFSKGPGNCANFYFNKYRYSAWKAAQAKEAQEKGKS